MSVDMGRIALLFPHSVSGVLESILTVARVEADLSDARRLAYFMAQTAHETAGYRWLRELGSPKYFARYEKRRDLGNRSDGDGYRYRGGGLLMLTGRANYQTCGEALGLPLLEDPESIVRPDVAVLTACWFWTSRSCNEKADARDFVGLTRTINGGTNGIKDRWAWLKRIEAALGR